MATMTTLTVEGYKVLPETGPRYQLVEGKLRMAPAPNRYHQRIASNIEFLIRGWIEFGGGKGLVYFAPFDVYLDNENVFQPDVLYFSPANFGVLTDEENLIIDRYQSSQPFGGEERHYAAVLLKASPREIARMAERIESSERQFLGDIHAASLHGRDEKTIPRQDLGSLTLSLAGASLFILLVGAFLRASEFGRLAWPIRLVSLALLGGLYLILADLRGWLLI